MVCDISSCGSTDYVEQLRQLKAGRRVRIDNMSSGVTWLSQAMSYVVIVDAINLIASLCPGHQLSALLYEEFRDMTTCHYLYHFPFGIMLLCKIKLAELSLSLKIRRRPHIKLTTLNLLHYLFKD